MPPIKNKKHKLTLFIFRRDLRLEDNTGLINALKNSEKVIPCFIFDPRQCEKNAYKSSHAIQFMLDSLVDLEQQLKQRKGKLFLFHGIPEKIVETIIQMQLIDAVYFNEDYTPFSQKRDQGIKITCMKHSVIFYSFDDALLNPPQIALKNNGKAYEVFSPFYKKMEKIPVEKPKKNPYLNYYHGKVPLTVKKEEIFEALLKKRKIHTNLKGGRKECLKKLSQLKKIKNYSKDHHYPFKKATTELSPHLKFTTCSVREIYHAINKKMPDSKSLLREIYWRDFFTTIAFYFPHVFGHAFHEKYDSLVWKNNKKLFGAWCQGKTGFPIVDAGMRQLNQTGYIHNRIRLITASFLIKDLHIDWRLGEKYFARKLIDYDPAVNNGNWQWVASTGTDAQPYFRIFNPWLQQRKFDPDCIYIKQWVPELQDLDKKIIHHWYKSAYHLLMPHYPAPIVNHQIEALKAKALFRA